MSSKRRPIPAKFRYHRPILSDTLPFEVPPIFSNGGYFEFLTKYDVRLNSIGTQMSVQWISTDDTIDPLIRAIFGTIEPIKKLPKKNIPPGYLKTTPIRTCSLKAQWTLPFCFDIAHKEKDFRRLTIIHPKSQLSVADFYSRRGADILYHTSLSDYSIRHPASVAKSSYFNDNLHKISEGSQFDTLEELGKEYKNLGSYFVYRRYSNIFKFYENYQYHNAERKFDHLLKLDISKCFDSIYTHSAAWTALGKQANKDNLAKSKDSFGGQFDTLMQNMNQGETNGIVIGPEFSRIFAEIILQGVDRDVHSTLKDDHGLKHRVDYQVFRYVDDYFVFYNKPVDAETIERCLSYKLRGVKLDLNRHKSETYSKPIITAQTIAKNKVRRVLAENLGVSVTDVDPAAAGLPMLKKRLPFIRTNALIVEYKTALYETGIRYSDLLNYTFASVEKRLEKILWSYNENIPEFKDPKNLVSVLIGILEFSFFAFSASPKVNFSIRLVRIVSTMVDGMRDLGIDYGHRHQVLKFAHDNIVRQLRRTGKEKHRYIETMYLLLGLEKLGRKYALGEREIADFFGVEFDGTEYSSKTRLDYFATTVSLMCAKNRTSFSKFRTYLERNIIDTLKARLDYLASDTECLLLFLDSQTCPFISSSSKQAIAEVFAEAEFKVEGHQPTPAELNARAVKLVVASVKAVPFWFVNWTGYDLSMALDMKRSREVY